MAAPRHLGQSAWLYDGATTLNIGLTGSEHTRNDGYQANHSQQLNEAGQVSGYSHRYNGGARPSAHPLGCTTARPRSTSA